MLLCWGAGAVEVNDTVLSQHSEAGLLSDRLISSDVPHHHHHPLLATKLSFICCSHKLLQNRFACLLNCRPRTDSCAQRAKGLVSFTYIAGMLQTRY